MSRYESSRFVKDPKIMNKEVLRKACDKLGWKYVEQGDDFLVTHLNRGEELYGEYALKLHDGQVTYNSYYLSNGGELVSELQAVFFPLNVEYARDSVISSFKANLLALSVLAPKLIGCCGVIKPNLSSTLDNKS